MSLLFDIYTADATLIDPEPEMATLQWSVIILCIYQIVLAVQLFAYFYQLTLLI